MNVCLTVLRCTCRSFISLSFFCLHLFYFCLLLLHIMFVFSVYFSILSSCLNLSLCLIISLLANLYKSLFVYLLCYCLSLCVCLCLFFPSVCLSVFLCQTMACKLAPSALPMHATIFQGEILKQKQIHLKIRFKIFLHCWKNNDKISRDFSSLKGWINCQRK